VCGICGIASRASCGKREARGERGGRELITKMTEPIAHRGPDDAGVEMLGPVGLGFRRLAVLDLSPSGHQPMTNEERDVWIVLNGEIYNYVELREDLRAQGVRFNSNSDTEVVLHLYRTLGTGMFERLNGMFAMAIYDVKRQSVILARDRMGKKPLFYWDDGDRLAFASELSALRVVPGFPAEIDRTAASLYLRLGFVPNWTCIHPGVHKLPPASWLSWDLASSKSEGPRSYWRLPPVAPDDSRDESYWTEKIRELLWDATRIRLRSDVPVGVFLSGGIDSALIAAASATGTGSGVNSITVSFPGWQNDEWPIADSVARHLNLHPTRLVVRSDAASLLPSVMGYFDEPFDDSSALPTYLVSQAARRQVTVALSGDGGDESFAGYRNHLMAWKLRGLECLSLSTRYKLSRALLPFTSGDSRLRYFVRRFGLPLGSWGFGSGIYPFGDWIEECVKPEYRLSDEQALAGLDSHLDKWPTATPIDQAQRNDLRLYMLDDILVKVDRMSMRHALEVRSPLLDFRVVELALQIPPRLRVKHGRNKYLLRCLAQQVLPDAVAAAPKRGFAIPLRQWLFDGPKAEWFREQVCTATGEDDILTPDGGLRLWSLARRSEIMTPLLFRVLAYRWWRDAVAGRS
jgi:asparagine synthase (glutamine-hydrolysing)